MKRKEKAAPFILKKESTQMPAPNDGKTRALDAPLNEGAAQSYREVQPAGFKDHPRSSIEAAQTDPDMDDTKGGE